jgi:hypothetical protein
MRPATLLVVAASMLHGCADPRHRHQLTVRSGIPARQMIQGIRRRRWRHHGSDGNGKTGPGDAYRVHLV